MADIGGLWTFDFDFFKVDINIRKLAYNSLNFTMLALNDVQFIVYAGHTTG